MEVYDYITADAIDDGDFIMVGFDPIEVKSHVDEDDAIVVNGYSHETGDFVTYILSSDSEVGLWGA